MWWWSTILAYHIYSTIQSPIYHSLVFLSFLFCFVAFPSKLQTSVHFSPDTSSCTSLTGLQFVVSFVSIRTMKSEILSDHLIGSNKRRYWCHRTSPSHLAEAAIALISSWSCGLVLPALELYIKGTVQHLQAYPRDFAGLVPDHHNKMSNTTIKGVTWIFWFPLAYKSYTVVY